MTDDWQERGVIRTGAERSGSVDADGVLQKPSVATFHSDSVMAEPRQTERVMSAASSGWMPTNWQ
ncbi:MAG: hypothetical protein AB9917_00235 [Negativicutes bacterium]